MKHRLTSPQLRDTLEPKRSTHEATPSIRLLDWRGLRCPMPILRTAKEVRRLGDRPGMLKVLADDVGFPLDLQSWCMKTGVDVLSLTQAQGVFEAVLGVNIPTIHRPPAALGSNNRLPAVHPPPQAPPPPGSHPNELAPTMDSPGRGEHQHLLLDCRGRQRPEPILKVAQAARLLNKPGARLEIVADDPNFPEDIRRWCQTTNTALCSLIHSESIWVAIIAPSPAAPNNTRPTSPHGLSSFASTLDPAREPTYQHIRRAPPTQTSRANVSAELPALKPSAPRPTPTPPESPRSQPHSSTTTNPRPGPLTPLRSSPNCLHLDLGGLDPSQLTKRLKALDNLALPGGLIVLESQDQGCCRDVLDWCCRRGHHIVFLQNRPHFRARIQLNPDPWHQTEPLPPSHPPTPPTPTATPSPAAPQTLEPNHAPRQRKNISRNPHGHNTHIPTDDRFVVLVLHNTLRALATAFLVAGDAAEAGRDVTIHFAFWGTLLLQEHNLPQPSPPNHLPTPPSSPFPSTTPDQPTTPPPSSTTPPSPTNHQEITRQYPVTDLRRLLHESHTRNIHLVACTTSMKIMGLRSENLMDLSNLKFGDLPSFIEDSPGTKVHTIS